MADESFFFCSKSFPGVLLLFTKRFSAGRISLFQSYKFINFDIPVPLWGKKKKKKRILSSQLVSPFSLKLYLLEPYWFSYHLNEELNAFNIWPQNPIQKSFSCLHSFPTTVIPLFGLTALHNQLGKSKRISSPGWNSVDSRWWESTPGQLPRNHAKSLKEGSKEEKVQHPIDF